jgi:Tfp pilus assembly protein PilW
MKPRRLGNESGVTLVELLVGLVVASIIMVGLLRMFIGESRLFGQWESQRTARDVARGASQVLSADLRRLEATGGVEAASASSITLRVPFSMGLVCASSAGSTTASLLPADSVMRTDAAPSGQAWRTPTGYSYAGLTSVAAGAAATCTAANITTVTGGRVVAITPGAGAGVTAGTPLFLYQRVVYEFGSAASGTALTRRQLSGAGGEEFLVETLVTSGTRFRFFVGTSDVAQDSPPADLTTLRGFELVLEGQGEYARPGEALPSAELSQPVFFRNAPN